MTSYLVTGGSGYFGALVVARLHAAGHAVRVLDLNDADDRPGGVEFVRGDVRDRAVVRDAVDGIDVVLNNVAQVPLAKDLGLLRTVNVDGTVNLLRASAAAGVRKVVHTSSSAVFGVPEANPVLPTTVPSPMEAYGHAKLAAEWACLAAAQGGLDDRDLGLVGAHHQDHAITEPGQDQGITLGRGRVDDDPFVARRQPGQDLGQAR